VRRAMGMVIPDQQATEVVTSGLTRKALGYPI
jgi:hypothetical protein